MFPRGWGIQLAVAVAAVLLAVVFVSLDSSDSDAAGDISITSSSINNVSEYGQSVVFTVHNSGVSAISVVISDSSIPKSGSISIGPDSSEQFRVSDLTVGDHTIIANGGGQSASLSFHVNKMILVIKAENKGKHFGDPDPLLTVVMNKSPISPAKVVGSIAYDGNEVGDHPIVQLVDYYIYPTSYASNYEVIFEPGTMTILPTMNLRDATDRINAIPNGILTYEDADKVAEAYLSFISLPEDWRQQIPKSLMDKLNLSIEQASAINHVSGSATKIDGVPWNVRITLASINGNDDSFIRFSGELYRQNIVQLFYVMLTDTITGEEFTSSVDETAVITISGIRTSSKDVSAVRELDGTAVPVNFNIVGNELSFEAASSGLYSTVVDAEIRDGADVSSAVVAIFLILGGIVASMMLDRRFRTGP
ncbi:MAG: hypothetical protein LBV63_03590 [Candidatus Methanoplasma sp.]|nr:hypothetical protein [Candidatus Methanoplasma sp.]